jgi:hypothetical protein
VGHRLLAPSVLRKGKNVILMHRKARAIVVQKNSADISAACKKAESRPAYLLSVCCLQTRRVTEKACAVDAAAAANLA